MSGIERLFWAAIGIGGGLTTFFFGISVSSDDMVRKWITILGGLALVVIGFRLAPLRKLRYSGLKLTKTEQKVIPDVPVDYNGKEPTPLDKEYQVELRNDRRWTLSALLDQSRSFDKYILTLAAGTFGLSLIFIQQIAPHPRDGTVGFLVGAWVLLGTSILFTLLSFLFSQASCQKQIDILDGIITGNIDQNNLPCNVFRAITVWLNWLSMSTFLVGVALLMFFALKNLPSPNGG